MSTPQRRSGNGAALGLIAVVAAAVGVTFVPEALAFPYRQRVGDTTVRSDLPIPAAIADVLARSDALLKASAIHQPGHGRRLFLTDGGWRWRVLSPFSPRAFAHTRPMAGAIVVNHADVARDRIDNGRAVGGTRRLSAVIAHERTHHLIWARFGPLADARYPLWLREGYADLVSGGGSLSDGEAAALARRGAARVIRRWPITGGASGWRRRCEGAGCRSTPCSAARRAFDPRGRGRPVAAPRRRGGARRRAPLLQADRA